MADRLRQDANPAALRLLLDIVIRAADNERAGYELLTIIDRGE